MNFNNLLADVVSRLNTCNRHRVRTVALSYNKITLDLVFLLLELGLIRGIRIRPKNII